MEKRSELQSWLIRGGLPETVAHEGAQTIGSAWQGPAGFHLPRGGHLHSCWNSLSPPTPKACMPDAVPGAEKMERLVGAGTLSGWHGRSRAFFCGSFKRTHRHRVSFSPEARAHLVRCQ